MEIWGSDANGQLGRDETKPEQYNKVLGPYAIQNARKWKRGETSTTMHPTQNDPNG